VHNKKLKGIEHPLYVSLRVCFYSVCVIKVHSELPNTYSFIVTVGVGNKLVEFENINNLIREIADAEKMVMHRLLRSAGRTDEIHADSALLWLCLSATLTVTSYVYLLLAIN
jgi:hypothetical protein